MLQQLQQREGAGLATEGNTVALASLLTSANYERSAVQTIDVGMMEQLGQLRLAASTAEGRRLAAMRTFFGNNRHLLADAIDAVRQVPLPPLWMALLSRLDSQINCNASRSSAGSSGSSAGSDHSGSAFTSVGSTGDGNDHCGSQGTVGAHGLLNAHSDADADAATAFDALDHHHNNHEGAASTPLAGSLRSVGLPTGGEFEGAF